MVYSISPRTSGPRLEHILLLGSRTYLQGGREQGAYMLSKISLKTLSTKQCILSTDENRHFYNSPEFTGGGWLLGPPWIHVCRTLGTTKI